MTSQDKKKIKIGNKIYSRKGLFHKKAAFHQAQTNLSFEEKIRRVVKLQNIVHKISNAQARNIKVWNLK